MIPQIGLEEAVDEQGLISQVGDDVRILHVEDDQSFADLVSEFLARENDSFDITTESEPSVALERLEDTHIDCVVSDYDMPEMDGLELLEAVRDDYPDLPFILFTGKGSEELASDAISAGVTEYLQKGGGTEQYSVLANRIENSVARYRAEQQVMRGFQAIETAHDGISLLDEDGKFVYVNQAYADITGYDREELIGEHWETLYRDEFTDRVYEEMLPQAREDVWEGKTEYVQKGGQSLTVEHKLAYTEDDTLICTISDVGDGDARQELSLKERAMDEAPIGIIITDAGEDDNPIIYANDGFVELTGYARDEIVGRNCRFLQGEATREEPVAEIHDAIEAGESVTVELRNYRKDGNMFWNRVTIAPLYDGNEVSHFVGFQQDVTPRREMLVEFEALGDVLSHDMNNPLTTMRGRLELALETGDVEHIEEAMPALDRMEQLVDDVADVLKSGAIVSEQNDIDISRIAKATWKSLDTGDGSLHVDGSPEVIGDRDSVRRMMDNLLGNSVEHGSEEVTVRMGELEDGFYIEDSGPGIPEDEREKIFEQGFTTKDGDEGSGIGMTSVRQIVLAHGWDIQVTDSNELDGVRFELHTGN